MPQLTARTIATAHPGRHHAGVTGLYLYVSPDGQTRRWIFRFTSPATHRPTETGLGHSHLVSLAQAQAKTLELQRKIALGVCPNQQKKLDKAAATKAVTTFAAAADGWIATRKSEWRSAKQMRHARLLLHRHGAPLADIPVGDITADRVQAALDQLRRRVPNMARRTLGMWERVFDYAKAKGLRSGDNPASWRGMHEYRFPRRRSTDDRHHAAMPYDQIPEFLRALHQRRSIAALCLEFVILTASRSGETIGMQWSEIDLENRVWTVPPERMKSGKEHRVPLSNRAMELLAGQRQYASKSPYVFLTPRPKNMLRLLHRMGRKETVHGFRSSFRDWCAARSDFGDFTAAELCLAHTVKSATVRAYLRTDLLDKRREIMNAWEAYCVRSL